MKLVHAQVMIPGMSAWGMVVCTGSNLLVRSAVVQAVGGFPGKTITEDYMLGLELAKAGFQSRYLQKYMALGGYLQGRYSTTVAEVAGSCGCGWCEGPTGHAAGILTCGAIKR